MNSAKKNSKILPNVSVKHPLLLLAESNDVQIRLAEVIRRKAIERYNLGVRRREVWFKNDKPEYLNF